MQKQEQQSYTNQAQAQDNQAEQNQANNNNNSDSDSQSGSKWKKIQKPEKWINLFMIDFNQCDGKKCTGRKMERFQMLKSIKDKQRKKKFKGIVLSAFGDRPASVEDLQLCIKHGICVIDCSWNRIQETSQFRFKNERILPYVVAGNPVNYGKPFQLSCVEALATALCAINYTPQAQYIMSKFGWADGFWSINSRIKQYGDCKTYLETEKLSQQIEQSENTMKQQYISDQSSNSDSSDNDNDNEENQDQNQNNNQQGKQSVKQQTQKNKDQINQHDQKK